MRLVSLEVRGLKSLRNTLVPDLKSYNAFIGRNNSGKSTVLQAIKLIGTIRKELERKAAAEIVTDKPTTGVIQISVTFQLSDTELGRLPKVADWRPEPVRERLRHWRYDFEMRVGDSPWPKLQLYLTKCGPIQGKDYGMFLGLHDGNLPEGGYSFISPDQLVVVLDKANLSIGDALASVWSQAIVGYGAPISAGGSSSTEAFHILLLRRFVDAMRYVNPTRSAADEMPVAEKRVLEASGADLTQVLETWRSSHQKRFQIMLQLLKALFVDVKNLHLAREGENTVLRIASGGDLEPLSSFRLSEVGSGVQQALMVAAGVVSAENGAVVLIEEPENNLHAAAQRVLARFLMKYCSETGKQALVTTHSTIFGCVSEECNTYLVRLDSDKGTIVNKLEPGDQPVAKQELGIRNVDLYGYDAVILWEGDSEEQAMPILLQALATKGGTTIRELGLTWRALGGSGNTRVDWVRQFLGLLKDTDIMPYVIMDDHPGVKRDLERLVEHDFLPKGHYHIWKEGRKKFGRNTRVDCEFEDNFTNEQLVNTAMEMAKDEGLDLHLDVDEFVQRCKEREAKTSQVLERYCREQGNYYLDKPELNRRLAARVSEELTGKQARTVERYEFENVADVLFQMLGIASRPPSSAAGERGRRGEFFSR